MKAKITRPDGTIIELEGEAAQVQAAIAQLSPPPLANLFNMPSANVCVGGAAPMLPPNTIFKSIP